MNTHFWKCKSLSHFLLTANGWSTKALNIALILWNILYLVWLSLTSVYLKTQNHMHHYNTFANLEQRIFSSVNPVWEGRPLSHPAEDIGTMGFLFTVQHDWSGERFSAQIAVRGTGQINTPNPQGDRRLPVQEWPEVFLIVCLVWCHDKRETWSAGEFLMD